MKFKTLLPFLSLVFLPILVLAQSKHTVTKQETLYSISKQYSITVNNLKKWNRLKSNAISVGQVLLVSDPFAKPEKVEEKTKLFQVELKSAINHTVKKGETLFKISKLYNVDVSTIKTLNNLNKNSLTIGQQLIISTPESSSLLLNSSNQILSLESFNKATVSDSNSIKDILSNFNMSQDELQLLNPNLDLTQIINGQDLNVIIPSRKIYANPYVETSSSDKENQKSIPTFEYSQAENGSISSSGELINLNAFTIAHPSLSFGSIILIKNLSTGKSCFARVNDRSVEQAIKITTQIKKAIDFNSIAQHEIILE